MSSAVLTQTRSDATERALLAELQHGLPLVSRPYAAIAARLGWSEAQVIAAVRSLIEAGVIKRWGVIVRHHELGYRANAMVVWDVPDARVDAVGRALGGNASVTLCYRRPRRLPDWPYNLFCMIHGRDRATVTSQIERLVDEHGLHDVDRSVLFSGRRFKQRGARYFATLQGNT